MNPDEAAAVAAAYHAAVVRLGAETLLLAIRLWQRQNPQRPERTGQAWLDDATALVMEQHRVAAMIGESYYRLYRALMTGRTVRSTYKDEPGQVALGELREDFLDMVGDDLYAPEGRDNGSWVGVDDYEPESPSDRRTREEAAEDQARFLLEILGIDNVLKNLGELDPDNLTGRELDEARNAVFDSAESRQSSTIERIAMNGARSFVHTAVANDQRAIGYVRISRTGSPCGFCAMLISRGFDHIYTSKSSAVAKTGSANSVRRGDASAGDEYHDNCHCVAVPVYSQEEYDRLPVFALNRELDDLWQNPDGIEQKPNEDFMTSWRRHFRNKQKASR